MDKLIETIEKMKPNLVRMVVFLVVHDNKGFKMNDVSDEIESIALQFYRDYMWYQARDLFVVRVQGSSFQSDCHRNSVATRVASLPDACFRNAVEFYRDPVAADDIMEFFCKGFCCATLVSTSMTQMIAIMIPMIV